MGLTLRVAGRPVHSTVLLCCGALGKGLEVPGPGLKVAQHWVREGIVALASNSRAFGKAQPDGRERRPGHLLTKALLGALPRPGCRVTRVLGSEGAL